MANLLNVVLLTIALFCMLMMAIATSRIAYKVVMTTTKRMSVQPVVVPHILIMAHMLEMIEWTIP